MFKTVLTSSLGLTLLLAANLSTQAAVIGDSYIGSDDHGYGDIIGDSSLFDVQSIDVSIANTTLMVDIHTRFAGRADEGLFAQYTRSGNGIGYSDLFLASAWNPFGTAPYLGDDAGTGTQWEYVIALDDRWSATGGTSTLYALAPGYTAGGTGTEDVLTSDYHMTGAIFRDNQEVSVNTAGANVNALVNGTWTVDNGFLHFEMDLFGTNMLEGKLAMHWGPTCANDVIEGVVPVPEPGSLILMATGLIGLVGSRIRKPMA